MTEVCLVPTCWEVQKSRGLCVNHYRQFRRGKDIGVTPFRPIDPKISGRNGGRARVPKGFAVKGRTRK